MKRFRDRVYVRDSKGLYVYDSGWETFRPVITVAWNPRTQSCEHCFGTLCSDPLDPHYGFGSPEMVDHCTNLTDEWIDKLESAEEESSLEAFWKWSHTPLTWMFDRPMALPPCVDASWDSRKSYPAKQKTLRKAPRSFDFRATKRRIK
jgi:hypothetical protein